MSKNPNQKRVAIVTGSARNIGKAIALRLAEGGCRVVLVDLLKNELTKTADEMGAAGHDVLPLECDVSQYEYVQKVGQRAITQWGRVDILVNNAGVGHYKGLLEITEAEFDQSIAINLKSQFSWCRAVAPTMLEQKSGRIVNISSMNALTGGPFPAKSRFAYATAKAGVLGMTRALARELAPTITVNAICPGVIKRDDGLSGAATGREGTVIRDIPLARLGAPADIAEVVYFLATATPMFITGEAIDVDGGQWMN